jgi:hypothetical protein
MHGVGASDRRVLRRIAGTIAANVATLSADPADPTKRKR